MERLAEPSSVERGEELLKLVSGPYEVNPYTAAEVAEKAVFRHFRPMELWVGREFIRRCLLPGTYYFDVYLLTEAALDFMRREPEAFWRMTIPYAHRIDAVCFRDREVWLLEFKIRLKYSAIGQLQGYRDWFERQYAPKKFVRLGVAFAIDTPELHATCERLGITLWHIR